MTTRVDRATLLLTVLLVNTFTADVSAGVLSTHSNLGVTVFHELPIFRSSDGQEFESDGQLWYSGAVPFGTGMAPLPLDASVTATGYAFAKLDPFDFLGLEVTATTIYPTLTNIYSASSSARAMWRDVVYVPGAEYGSAIRLVVEVDGEFGFDGEFSGGIFNFAWTGNFNGWGLAAGGDQGYVTPGSESGWDSIVRGPDYRFHGVFHMDIPYNSGYGGFAWLLEFYGAVSTRPYLPYYLPTYEFARASSVHSVGLTAITDLDGNPITGLSFDSGMVYVPEVPSMYLAPGAGIILFTLARLHSMRKLRV